MCAILGISSTDGELGMFIMKELLNQSQIRGRHATGISFVVGDKIKTISKPIPAKEFIKQELPNSKLIIGHCRYSTSDIRFNQPIADENFSISHNGVITQEPFEDWGDKYNMSDFKTENDSEILFKLLSGDKDPFMLDSSSMSCVFITKNGITGFRNNSRPLWLFKNDHFMGFASTEDIIVRTFAALEIEVEIKKIEPYKFYNISQNLNTLITSKSGYKNIKDLQFSTKLEAKYLS